MLNVSNLECTGQTGVGFVWKTCTWGGTQQGQMGSSGGGSDKEPEISTGTALEKRLWTWSLMWWEPFKWWKVCVRESDRRRFSSSIWCLFKWVKEHVHFLFLHDNSLGLGSHNLTVDWTFPFDLSLLWDQLRFNWSFCLYLCFDSWRLARAWLISI